MNPSSNNQQLNGKEYGRFGGFLGSKKSESKKKKILWEDL